MKRILSRTAWGFMLFLAVGISVYASSFFAMNADQGILSLKDPELLNNLILYRIPFLVHVAGGILALCIGPLQFFAPLRNKRMKLHRTLGKIYILAILFAGLSGIPISLTTEGGWIARIGFCCLALTWLYTTGQGYWQIRQGNVQAHQQWMMRSYAATFAAVTLRIILPILLGVLRWDFDTAYATIAWACWVPNLLVVEWYIRRTSTGISQPFSATAS